MGINGVGKLNLVFIECLTCSATLKLTRWAGGHPHLPAGGGCERGGSGGDGGKGRSNHGKRSHVEVPKRNS